jgi:23S rRNA (adenine2030-N6)-methyltransferase
VNYRHAYHAGNFADVFKHALLARMLVHLNAKPTPWRFIDTHAGIGVYDLESGPAARTREADLGIRRLMKAKLPQAAAELLAPYQELVRQVAGRENHLYPGSPEVAARLARPQDRLTLAELHPEDAATLRERYAGDRRVTLRAGQDGWVALKAAMPPPERRGLVLVDPPFEEEGEFTRLVRAITELRSRWATGMLALWYPVKDRAAVNSFLQECIGLGTPKTLHLQLLVDAVWTPDRLIGCGFVIINPPWLLIEEARELLPVLAGVLAQGAHTAWRAEWLVPE